jgi:hypothetical protein
MVYPIWEYASVARLTARSRMGYKKRVGHFWYLSVTIFFLSRQRCNCPLGWVIFCFDSLLFVRKRQEEPYGNVSIGLRVLFACPVHFSVLGSMRHIHQIILLSLILVVSLMCVRTLNLIEQIVEAKKLGTLV